jgi:NACalpha-BTF3-like transcription factor
MLTQTQIEILTVLQGKLVHGDITLIAEKMGFSRVHVSNVLNPSSENFNQDIVDEAVKLVTEREQVNKNTLKKLTA